MQEQPTLTPAERDGQIDGEILAILVDSEYHRPWAVEEIAREIGQNPTDSLNRLYGAGLIHRLGAFVWATRAAVVVKEIDA
jgi:hypothetical protein